jgi:hypothetical protein
MSSNNGSSRAWIGLLRRESVGRADDAAAAFEPDTSESALFTPSPTPPLYELVSLTFC